MSIQSCLPGCRCTIRSCPCRQNPHHCLCSPPWYDGDDGANYECPIHGADAPEAVG